MQGFERADRQLLDAAALAGHLVPAGSMFAFLAAHRAEVFPDEDYADLFAPPGVGRAPVPATQMAAVMTLQALHDYCDRETAGAVKFDVRWKAAIGAALDDPGPSAASRSPEPPGMSYLPGMMDRSATQGISAVPVSIGVSFPESVMPGTPLPDIAGLARFAEQAGLDGVWVGDRLAAGELSVLDSGLSLAVAAAVTSRIAVGYAIYVPSLRPLAWAAKQVATLQHIAGGRLQLGVAVGGGGDAEYLAAGFRRSDRARRTDEFLALLPGLLAGQPLPHASGASGADAIRLRPAVPVPPLWVGGTSLPALRRAVRFSDGWLSGLQTPREFAASRSRLFELSDQAGRPRPLTGIGLHAAIGTGPGRDLTEVTAGMLNSMYGVPDDRAREVAIAGTPAQVASQLAPYAEAGADLIVVVCDPAPSTKSSELVAEVRLLLKAIAALPGCADTPGRSIA